ncbi:amidase signature domain-containing protein [Xylariales sp. PMI_506]|nr:amidase signature domain-containing protein [Xylariales sp. PMI_506]
MSSIELNELTIDKVHSDFRLKLYTAEELVSAYLQRIQRIDRDEGGPRLNSTLALNPDAIAEAKYLDVIFQKEGRFIWPLHGIPVVVKDSVYTKGITTTFGSIVAKDFVPDKDGTVVTKLKEAGAIILAKTSLPDFGTDYFSDSSLNGRVRNPYDLDRDPGGSSSGTAAAVAANLALAGIGTDSSGSIRIPASFCGLFGLRPTVGLISKAGGLPGAKGQSTLGPMCRTVRDAALLMDAIVGFDEEDPQTGVLAMAIAGTQPPGASYAAAGVTALLYPTNKTVAPRAADIDRRLRAYFPTNTGLASQLRFPAATVPVGFSAVSGMPVGLEIMGTPFGDQVLIGLAYAVEQVTQVRRAPLLETHGDGTIL